MENLRRIIVTFRLEGDGTAEGAMKLIVTGATGFIGRNLVEGLHGDGHHVLATGRSTAVGERLRERGIEFRPADIVDSATLAEAFSPADCLIHCAARSGDWGRYREFHEPNVIGTRNVIDACLRHGIPRIIFVSTPSVYFTGEDRIDISEDDPLPARQRISYARTKLAGETELLARRSEGYDVMIFRPRAVYGPHDATIVPRILRLAEKRRLPLINDGRAVIDPTYVGNFVDAVRSALTAGGGAWNEAYNISNGEPIEIRDFFASVLEALGVPFRPKNVPEAAAMTVAGFMELVGYLPFGPKQPALTRFSVGYMATSTTMSIEKAHRKLGYAPRIDNREGIERYAAWYRSERAR
jgi:nucleoside-diphosphate-sugar epimerase